MHVSTGQLPPAARVQLLVDRCYSQLRAYDEGSVSTVYPALAAADPDLFGLSIATVDGHVYSAGDADVAFPVMSVAKPFVFALMCERLGPDAVRERVGVNATGRPFNSLGAVEDADDGRTNPMVNSGALVTTSLTPGRTADERLAMICGGLSAFAGRTLGMDDGVLTSALRSNQRNQAISRLLESVGLIEGDPADAVLLYTQQSCVAVSAHDLAVMGATLADGGINPVTGAVVVSAETCRYTLAVMATAGLYESSGDWLYTVGLPGKSGISGGIVTAAPGKGGLGTFSPRLDRNGNSVRGQRVAAQLSADLGLDLFRSSPHA